MNQYSTSADLAIMIYHIHKWNLRWNSLVKRSIFIKELWCWNVKDTCLAAIDASLFFPIICFLAGTLMLYHDLMFNAHLSFPVLHSLAICYLEIDILIDLCVC